MRLPGTRGGAAAGAAEVSSVGAEGERIGRFGDREGADRGVGEYPVGPRMPDRFAIRQGNLTTDECRPRGMGGALANGNNLLIDPFPLSWLESNRKAEGGEGTDKSEASEAVRHVGGRGK